MEHIHGVNNVNVNYAPVNTNVQNFVNVETEVETNINVNQGQGSMGHFDRDMVTFL